MNTYSFASRHIGPRENDLQDMLETVGVDSIDQLIYETLPDDIRLKKDLELAPAMSEHEYLAHSIALAAKNKIFRTYIGLGYHQSITPPVIQRNILENPGWYTAYTPYQAEIAQGRLEALSEFPNCHSRSYRNGTCQCISCLMKATAAAEAMSLLFEVRDRDQKKNEVNKFFVSEEVLPQTIDVLKTRAIPLDIELVIGDHEEFDFSNEFFGAFLQYPGKMGQVYDYAHFRCKSKRKQYKNRCRCRYSESCEITCSRRIWS